MSFIKKLLGRQETFLNSADYKVCMEEDGEKEAKLDVHDRVDVSVEKGVIKIIFEREVTTLPHKLFKMEVSFGCFLPIKEEYQETELWDIEELKKEIIQEGNILNGLVARTSLLISQFIASYGQIPIITPPQYIE